MPYDRHPVPDPVFMRVEPDNSGDQADRQRRAWMAAAQAGDKVAYARVLADSLPLARKAARRQGVPVDMLDDVVQETLITVHRVRHTYDPARSYDAWLGAIARRRAIDALRSHGRRNRREVSDEYTIERHADPDDASTGLERSQRSARLHAAIGELPPRQREAAEQLGLRERTLAEASAHTGRRPGALKVNLHRALKSLHDHLHGEP